MARLFQSSQPRPAELPQVRLGNKRGEAMQRLQLGLGGVVLMILLVGLASIIQGRAEMSEATAVPQAAPTTEPMAPEQQADPLVEAGVVPDMPGAPAPSPSATPPPPRTDQGVADTGAQ